MDIDDVMDEALRVSPQVMAIACADVRAGFVLGASARENVEREAAANAAACAAQLCAIPRVEDEARDASGAMVVSPEWVHAYARVRARPELVVVGIARGDANVAQLLDDVRRVAGGLSSKA